VEMGANCAVVHVSRSSTYESRHARRCYAVMHKSCNRFFKIWNRTIVDVIGGGWVACCTGLATHGCNHDGMLELTNLQLRVEYGNSQVPPMVNAGGDALSLLLNSVATSSDVEPLCLVVRSIS
jgi:hypothetical protein